MSKTYGEKVADRLIQNGAFASQADAKAQIADCPAISQGTKSLLLALIDRNLIKMETRP